MKQIWIKPAEGVVLRDHRDKMRIIEGPKLVRRDGTILRRLRDGDAIECEDPNKVQPKPELQKKPQEKPSSSKKSDANKRV